MFTQAFNFICAKLASRRVLAVAAACIGILPLANAHAQCTERWLTSPAQLGNGGMDRTVRSLLTLPNGDFVAGGDFTTAGGVPVRSIARWNGQWWVPLGEGLQGGLSGANTAVRALLALPNGTLVAGGNFTLAGSSPVGCVARWDGAAWSSLGLGMNGLVHALVSLPNGDLVAGGSFTTADGLSVGGIARWNGVSWSPLGTGAGGSTTASVNALAVLANGDLVAGGNFTTMGGVAANRIARWDGSAWTPFGAGANGTVHALAVLANGDLAVGGSFTTMGGVSANRVARWNGASWSPLGSGVAGTVAPNVSSLVVLANGDLVAGGRFTNASGASASNVARWDGASWSPLGAGFPDEVLALARGSGGGLLVGGGTLCGTLCFGGIGRWDGDQLGQIHAGLSGEPAALQPMPNGDLILGGWINSGSGVVLNHIARWDGTAFSPLGSGMVSTQPVYWTTEVRRIAMLPNGDIVAGGVFTKAGAVNARNIARWDGAAWSPLGSGLTGFMQGTTDASRLLGLAVLANGDVVAGGYFTTAGGVSAKNIARWNGTVWSEIGSGVTSTDGFSPFVSAFLELPNGDLVVGGHFTAAGGVGAKHIARWDGATWTALGSGLAGGLAGVPIAVYQFVRMPNGDLVACGDFTVAGGVTVNRIARWDGAAWSSMGSGMDNDVYALELLPNGDLLAGGAFTTAGGVSARGIARWNGTSWSAFGAGLTGTQAVGASCFARMQGGELIVGGNFNFASSTPCVDFARWSETGVPWVAQDPTPQSIDAGGALVLSAACASGYDFDGAVTFQWRRNGIAIANGAGGASKGGGKVSGASGALTADGLVTTLSIAGARPSDAGSYTVVFTNNCGDATSLPAAVAIAASCAADLTGDGSVDARDITVLLGAWGTSAGDLNADLTTNEQDFAALLAAWGACG
jgi:trimeric autotransporter adhesin